MSNRRTIPKNMSGNHTISENSISYTTADYETAGPDGFNRKINPFGKVTYETDSERIGKIVEIPTVSRQTSHNLASDSKSFSLVDKQKQCDAENSITCSKISNSNFHRCIDCRMGCSLSICNCFRELDPTGNKITYKHFRNESSSASNSEISGHYSRQTCVNCFGQFHSCKLSEQTGRYPFLGISGSSVENIGVGSKESDFSQSTPYSRLSQYVGRPVVSKESSNSNRVDLKSTSVQVDLQPLVATNDRSVCNKVQQSTPSICEPSPRFRSLEHRCNVPKLGGPITLCISSDNSFASNSDKVEKRKLQNDISSTGVSNQKLVSRPTKVINLPTSKIANIENVAKTTKNNDLSSKSRNFTVTRVEPSGSNSQEFSVDVASRIAHPQRKSTTKVYKVKWNIFLQWCKDFNVNVDSLTVAQFADFCLFLFDTKKLRPGTIEGYRSAISNELFGKISWNVGKDESISRLISSFYKDRPNVPRVLPNWDLIFVLQRLSQPPFEPLAQTSLKLLTLKTIFLVALASGKRRSEIHALLFSKFHQIDNWDKVCLQTSSEFIAKNQITKQGSSVLQPIVLSSLKGYVSPLDEQDSLLCPVRALKFYLDRTKNLRQGKKCLFISFQPNYKKDISPQTISSWLKSVIQMTYKLSSKELDSLPSVKAHEIRHMAASWAFKGGIALEDIMTACSWRSQNTFIQFYLKDIAFETQEKFSLMPLVVAQHVIS